MKDIVLDASWAAARAMRETEALARVDRLSEEDFLRRRFVVPAVFWYEVRHALLRARRRGRIDAAQFAAALEQFQILRTEADAGHKEEAVFALAERHGLSFYDASYLETALRRGAALATLDRKLLAAAEAESVPPASG